MNQKIAHRLIHPLTIGESPFPGWVLESIQVKPDGLDQGHLQVVYTFAPPQVKIIVWPKAHGGESIYQTANFLIQVQAQNAFEAHSCRKLLQLIAQNDKGESFVSPHKHIPQTIDKPLHSLPSVAYIIPGHIGNFYDLSFRAIQTLRDGDVICIEYDKVGDLEEIEKVFGISLSTKQILKYHSFGPTEAEALTQAVAKGLDLCIFGAGEGHPTISDPGWMVVSHIMDLQIPIRTLSGGGALSAAVMRLGHSKPFSFWGVLHNDRHRDCILWYLEDLGDTSKRGVIPLPICLAYGQLVVELWADICHAVRHLSGTLRLMMNLTRPKEWECEVDISMIDRFDPSTLAPKTKIVMVFELDGFKRHQSPVE